MKTTKNNNHSGSNSLNKKHVFVRPSQVSSNKSSTQHINESDKSKNSSKNILEEIYDDEFVIMINQLSSSIKNYYRSNNKNFNVVKSILNTNEMNYNKNNELLVESFNNLENSFSFFYSTAKQIFKSMKIYRREKIANILAQNKKKTTNNRNNNNSINLNVKQRNSDAKINQLLKSPIEYNSKSIFGDESKNKVLSINILSNSKNKNINEKNVSEFCIENNDENESNTSKTKNNFDEYLDVINVYNKKKAVKSESNITKFKFNEEHNSNSSVSSVKKENRTKRIYISSLNKSDKKLKNKKLSIFEINSKTNNKRIKSSDKNIKQSFNSQKRKDSIPDNKNDLDNLEELNN